MVVNLEQVSFASIDGMRVTLHYKDGGLHMQRFDSIEAMLSGFQHWQTQTSLLGSTITRSENPTDPAARHFHYGWRH
jgi:hypothetical protein